MANSVTDLRVTGTVCAFFVAVQQPLSLWAMWLLSVTSVDLLGVSAVKSFICLVEITDLVKREIKLFFLRKNVQLSC